MGKKLGYFSALLLVSCASFSDFYTPYFNAYEEPVVTPLSPSEEPEIYYSENIDADLIDVLSYRYYVVGQTSFNGPNANIEYKIKQQCRENSATLALYNITYTDTRTGTVTLPGTQTSYSSGSVFDSSGGSANYFGTTTTTTTNNYNYSVQRYDYLVYYFVPFTHSVMFGAVANDISSEQARHLRRNTGAYLYVVYRDTPAYRANIVNGDVIIRMNDTEIYNANGYFDFFERSNSGDEVIVTIFRENKEIKLTVILD